MEQVALDDEDARAFDDGTTRRELTGPLETAFVAINRYRVPPGAGLPGGIHAHLDQEEVFVVRSGEATFETLDGVVTVAASEAIRFAPGEYQSGRNEGEADLVVLALGAPRDSEDLRIPFPCPACGFDGLRLEPGGDRFTVRCPDCEAEWTPKPCPACGSDDLRTTLDDQGDPQVVCRACGAAYAAPPLDG